MSKAFLVYGATGKQGGALVRSLITQPGFSPSTHTIYGVTRDIFSGSAKKLASLSPAIKPVKGDFTDAPAVFAQLDPKPIGVYIVHGLGSDETRNCNNIIDEAVRNGAKHIVYSSVDRGGKNSDNDPTDIPHFITKYNVEVHLKEAARASNGSLTYTILRPVFFLDNLKIGFFAKVTATAWRNTLGDTPLQVVDTQDIGDFGALAFMNADDALYKNQSISLAGDRLTFAQADEIWREKAGEGIPTTFGMVAGGFLFMIKELGTMFTWFRDVGYQADIKDLNAIKPMVTFRQWVEREVTSN